MTKNKKLFWMILVVIGLLCTYALIMGAIYKNQIASQKKAQAKEEKQTVDKIAKLLRLPDENPIITTVYNEKDFENNNLFRPVKKGDKILLFINAKQAVIYRPSNNQVIEVLPVKANLKTK
jgi:hypothetical protein